MHLIETQPPIDVNEAEFKRLLGLPPDYVMAGRVAELAQHTRAWYAEHGRPWFYARRLERFEADADALSLEGVRLKSPEMHERARRAEADGAFVVALGAGAEAEKRAAELWLRERPDEYFFLETYASAVVEHLMTRVGARLCEWADAEGLAVLPHYSPGYQGWHLSDQAELLKLAERDGAGALPSPLEVLESGMLVPKKSQLAVFGLTRRRDLVTRLTELVPCHTCSYAPCRFRRAPYKRSAYHVEGVPGELGTERESRAAAGPLGRKTKYGFSRKALERWRSERIEIKTQLDGRIEARFRFDGSTCSNMGVPLAFDYRVALSGPDDGYRILEAGCTPAQEDSGHHEMCGYIEDRERMMADIAAPPPLMGQSLDDAVAWNPVVSPAGCLCSRASRSHKWRIVFQTLHYGLVENDKPAARNA